MIMMSTGRINPKLKKNNWRYHEKASNIIKGCGWNPSLRLAFDPFLRDLSPTIANDNKRNHQPNIIELFFEHIPHIRDFKYDHIIHVKTCWITCFNMLNYHDKSSCFAGKTTWFFPWFLTFPQRFPAPPGVSPGSTVSVVSPRPTVLDRERPLNWMNSGRVPNPWRIHGAGILMLTWLGYPLVN